jgi:glycerophosphoryl diester phosphodiesterase
MNEFVIFAHRGASGTEPENTLRSFRKALEIGAEWMELDVHAVEGVPVVFHDHRLDHRTNGSGPISERTLEYVRSLKTGLGERIPLLKEVLSLLAGKAGLNIELKGGRTAEPVAGILKEFLDGTGWTHRRILVSSFDHAELARFGLLIPNIPIGALFREAPPSFDEAKSVLGAFSVHLHRDSVSRQTVEKAHRLGLRVFVYTVNEPADMDRLKSIGADGAFTDFPERFIPVRGPALPL